MAKTFLTARWENLVMANYSVDPKILLPFLPTGVELDLYDGKCYVSLVGFLFKNTRLFRVPIPLLGTFEEINLRFYVKRTEHDKVKRGVVFINETVPYKAVAWLANKLYNEHYISIPTKHQLSETRHEKNMHYGWKTGQTWQSIDVKTNLTAEEMIPESIEEFIFEHYYGYTKVSAERTQEYRVNHPRWQVYKVLDSVIRCDFETMYGPSFARLNQQQPDSVIVANGSAVSVDWKRIDLRI